MPAWVGPLHGLVEVGCLSGLRESAPDMASYTTGLSGRVRGRVTPRLSREWSCSIDITDPHKLGVLEELIWARRGEPLWLVTEAARAQNVQPPPASELDRDRGVMMPVGWGPSGGPSGALTVGGPVQTIDGVAASSTLVDGGVPASSPVMPCVPGEPVTHSVYVPAGGSVELVWVDSAGTETSADVSPAAAVAGDRVWVTATPTTQTACRLIVSGASWFTRAQTTWTGVAVPWVRGRGAEKVHLGPLSEEIVMALTDGSRNLSSASYVIREVG